MTLRVAGNPLGVPRPAGTVKEVAKVLPAHVTVVRDLCASGELESYRLGKRAIRIYWDSVADYQNRQQRQTKRRREPGESTRARRVSAASDAADRAALASLKAAGCLKNPPSIDPPKRKS